MRALWRTPLIGPAIYDRWLADARRKSEWIAPHISPQDTLVEIGSGPGTVMSVMRESGYSIQGLDVRDTSYREDLRPQIYAGGRMPFADNAFDAALLLTVLHHTPDPDAVLAEAARIARRVLVIEDIFTSAFQRRLTKIADSIANLEVFGHPHTNRNDEEWRASFERLGLHVSHASQKPYAQAFLQILYVVEPPA